MNPILLKSGGKRASDNAFLCSVIVRGKHYASVDYGTLAVRTEEIRSLVEDAHVQLSNLTNAECIVIEGAGSCTELNLMDRDVVNIPLVRQLRCPWLLVADIDKGGVFAQIFGTKECLSETDWDLCRGIIVNKLRGDPAFFEPGPTMIENHVHKPVFVIPWLYNLHLPEEDGVGIETRLKQEPNLQSLRDHNSAKPAGQHQPLIVVAVAYPYVSIDSDLIPLERDPDVILEWRRNILPPKPYPETHAIILPGSRLTRFDLDWLVSSGWGSFIKEHVKLGGAVFGLCGGFQMLGTVVRDEQGIEGEAGISEGLGLLPVETKIEDTYQKIVTPRRAILKMAYDEDQVDNEDGVLVDGFELHCGRTYINNSANSESPNNVAKPLLEIFDSKRESSKKEDGARVGRVSGCYLHGILDNIRARRLLLHLALPPVDISCCDGSTTTTHDISISNYDNSFDKLADHLESCGLTLEVIVDMLSADV